ncbi:hypothetical protein HPB48_017594 [Haemaphysalis longicornis]|uniref:Uncharacterized protein n=1 Tax=Haemaphysalis longicornis TaxID=44386 RepID=A0A9J6GNN2_HAELO|nr:hypothetical protein HPB48_017594 [Haemaphysalis longicornis]
MALVGTGDVACHGDTLLDSGKLDEASKTLKASSLVPDHVYPEQTSDARLLYYLAEYVARRKIMTTKCQDCFDDLLTSAEDADKDISSFTAFCDSGGLLYPSQELFSFIGALKDLVDDRYHDCFDYVNFCGTLTVKEDFDDFLYLRTHRKGHYRT